MMKLSMWQMIIINIIKNEITVFLNMYNFALLQLLFLFKNIQFFKLFFIKKYFF